MKVVVLGLTLVLCVFSNKCPIWSCGQAGSDSCITKTVDSSQKAVLNVNTNCLRAGAVCFLQEYTQEPEDNFRCSYPSDLADLLDSEYLDYRYCSERLWSDLKCNTYCMWNKTWNNASQDYDEDWVCNNTRFLEAQGHTEGKKSGWSECVDGSECASGRCSCAPNTNGKGRCTTSIYDDNIYKYLFDQVCSSTTSMSWWWTEYECALWTRIKSGHVIQGLKNSNDTLQCLLKYSDREMLLATESETSWEWYHFIPLFIVLGCCCWCLICTKWGRSILRRCCRGKNNSDYHSA